MLNWNLQSGEDTKCWIEIYNQMMILNAELKFTIRLTIMSYVIFVYYRIWLVKFDLAESLVIVRDKLWNKEWVIVV